MPEQSKPVEALIVVDMQYDFCPGGALAVPEGDTILPGISALMQEHPLVVATQDWHPAGHRSFASAHEGKQPFETAQMFYGDQVLWPDHCVQGTHGAQFLEGLPIERAALIQRKGMNPRIDSYSAFFENDRETRTGLDGWLKDRGVTRVRLCGLAYDFCVFYSALDAAWLGYHVTVERSLCRAIDLDGSAKAAESKMHASGITIEG